MFAISKIDLCKTSKKKKKKKNGLLTVHFELYQLREFILLCRVQIDMTPISFLKRRDSPSE